MLGLNAIRIAQTIQVRAFNKARMSSDLNRQEWERLEDLPDL